MIFVYTTQKNTAAAKALSRHLLEMRLAACINFFSVSAMYRWDGKIEDEKEIVMLIKTKNSNWRKVKEEIERLHADEVPCIVKIAAEANPGFDRWVTNET